jgi:hypothetical protein
MNGWPASPSLLTRTIVVEGAAFRVADNRDVETVFVYLLTRYALTVEPLYGSQCGGFNYRPNRNNPSVLSNHSSATAVDVNSLKHPNGVEASRTFTAAQIAAVHAILASVPELGDLIHWGGDWHPPLTPDPMHFELHNHDLALLARVADRIRGDIVTPDDIDTIVARTTEAVVKALLDTETVDKAKQVTVRQSLNQTRNDAAKAAGK